MQYNECKTCGAKDGRAGLLINDECLNCHETRKSGAISIHTGLNRTPDELNKTFGILDSKVEIYNVQPGDDVKCGVGKNNI